MVSPSANLVAYPPSPAPTTATASATALPSPSPSPSTATSASEPLSSNPYSHPSYSTTNHTTSSSPTSPHLHQTLQNQLTRPIPHPRLSSTTPPANTVYVVERLGRFNRLLYPGTTQTFLPIVDRVIAAYSTRHVDFTTPHGGIVFVLSTSCRVTVQATWTISITDPKHLAYSNSPVDVDRFCRMLMHSVLRDAIFARSDSISIGKKTPDLPQAVRTSVNQTFSRYGLVCHTFIVVNMRTSPSTSLPPSALGGLQAASNRNRSLNLAHAPDYIHQQQVGGGLATSSSGVSGGGVSGGGGGGLPPNLYEPDSVLPELPLPVDNPTANMRLHPHMIHPVPPVSALPSPANGPHLTSTSTLTSLPNHHRHHHHLNRSSPMTFPQAFLTNSTSPSTPLPSQQPYSYTSQHHRLHHHNSSSSLSLLPRRASQPQVQTRVHSNSHLLPHTLSNGHINSNNNTQQPSLVKTHPQSQPQLHLNPTSPPVPKQQFPHPTATTTTNNKINVKRPSSNINNTRNNISSPSLPRSSSPAAALPPRQREQQQLQLPHVRSHLNSIPPMLPSTSSSASYHHHHQTSATPTPASGPMSLSNNTLPSINYPQPVNSSPLLPSSPFPLPRSPSPSKMMKPIGPPSSMTPLSTSASTPVEPTSSSSSAVRNPLSTTTTTNVTNIPLLPPKSSSSATKKTLYAPPPSPSDLASERTSSFPSHALPALVSRALTKTSSNVIPGSSSLFDSASASAVDYHPISMTVHSQTETSPPLARHLHALPPTPPAELPSSGSDDDDNDEGNTMSLALNERKFNSHNNIIDSNVTRRRSIPTFPQKKQVAGTTTAVVTSTPSSFVDADDVTYETTAKFIRNAVSRLVERQNASDNKNVGVQGADPSTHLSSTAQGRGGSTLNTTGTGGTAVKPHANANGGGGALNSKHNVNGYVSRTQSNAELVDDDEDEVFVHRENKHHQTSSSSINSIPHPTLPQHYTPHQPALALAHSGEDPDPTGMDAANDEDLNNLINNKLTNTTTTRNNSSSSSVHHRPPAPSNPSPRRTHYPRPATPMYLPRPTATPHLQQPHSERGPSSATSLSVSPYTAAYNSSSTLATTAGGGDGGPNGLMMDVSSSEHGSVDMCVDGATDSDRENFDDEILARQLEAVQRARRQQGATSSSNNGSGKGRSSSSSSQSRKQQRGRTSRRQARNEAAAVVTSSSFMDMDVSSEDEDGDNDDTYNNYGGESVEGNTKAPEKGRRGTSSGGSTVRSTSGASNRSRSSRRGRDRDRDRDRERAEREKDADGNGISKSSSSNNGGRARSKTRKGSSRERERERERERDRSERRRASSDHGMKERQSRRKSGNGRGRDRGGGGHEREGRLFSGVGGAGGGGGNNNGGGGGGSDGELDREHARDRDRDNGRRDRKRHGKQQRTKDGGNGGGRSRKKNSNSTAEYTQQEQQEMKFKSIYRHREPESLDSAPENPIPWYCEGQSEPEDTDLDDLAHNRYSQDSDDRHMMEYDDRDRDAMKTRGCSSYGRRDRYGRRQRAQHNRTVTFLYNYD